MMLELSTIQIAQFYVAMIFCFSICLVLVAGKLNARPVFIWILSNFFIAGGMSLFIFVGFNQNTIIRPIFFMLECLGPTLKFLALSYGWKWRKIKAVFIAIIILSLFIPMSLFAFANASIRPFLFNFSPIFLSFFCIFAVLFNRYWKGIFGRAVMLVDFILASVGIILKSVKSWEQGNIFLLLGKNSEVIFLLSFLAMIGLIGQMAFLLMLTSRTQYYAKIKQRREERIRARSISLKLQNKEISRLLDEQRRLLETLTHEVRQPINNAQAALQGIMSDLHPTRSDRNRVLPVAIRIQGILDEITLSLSNAIVGATLVERGEGAELRDCEIISIAQLALLDCPERVRERIVVDFPKSDIFLAVDPILLRLALRNLLDNAAKFSIPNTEIVYSISLDETHFGVLISVSNSVDGSFVFDRSMLERGKRGRNAEGKEGTGIGLYVFNEIARIHRQDMIVDDSVPGKITFGMLLAE